MAVRAVAWRIAPEEAEKYGENMVESMAKT